MDRIESSKTDATRVVITGTGAISPLGSDTEALWAGLLQGKSAVNTWPELSAVEGLRTTAAALVPELDSRSIDRKKRRYMSSMSVYATLAADEALAQAGLSEAEIHDSRVGVSAGSTTGSTTATEDFFRETLPKRSIEHLKSTHFFKIMNSSCAANLAQALSIKGRVLAPSAACATGTVAIGLGAECIAAGKQDVMICGGADEMHPLNIGVFDTLEASSRAFNDSPHSTPRPFDRRRDGIICGEGAGMVVLESLPHARARGATILGEILGFAFNSSPGAIANPAVEAIVLCLQTALLEAGLKPARIGYVNAHATGTVQGDEAECRAIEAVFGRQTPVSSLKGHMGHTMAACGPLELIATLRMMQEGVLIPTRNLESPDAVCGRVQLLQKNVQRSVAAAMINSFALGGMNSALVVSGRSFDE
jgi:3-oxoacyl-[acyl-carrier-protein] synthase II